MGEVTSIAWTTHSFNPWEGCTKVSPGCDHCYAETLNHRWGKDNWGKGKPRRITSNAYWNQPLRWDKDAQILGEKQKVFCASLADVMDDEAPEGQRERLWELIEKTPHLIWQLLTKRPHRYARYLPLFTCPENIWLGTSAESQEFYDIRWPILHRAAEPRNVKTFISYEPALGPLSIAHHPLVPDWIICGGESGIGRRDMEQEWAEKLKVECDAMGVKFFMKQLSARTPTEGAKLIPPHLLVRDFPA